MKTNKTEKRTKLYPDYGKGEYLHSTEDMAHHSYDAYKVDNEIHLVHSDGSVSIASIEALESNPDVYLWSPFAEFTG